MRELLPEGDWRRPACSDACAVVRALVAERDYRGWRNLEIHDHAAYEQTLVWTVSLLGQMLDRTRSSRGHAGRASMGHADSSAPSWATVETGPLVIDVDRCEAWLHGRLLPLSPQEWRLLALLAWRIGRVQRRDVLLRRLFPTHTSTASYRTLLQRLRARLGDARDLIVTRPGLGLLLRQVPVAP